METEPKWLPFSRLYFHMHFLEWRYINFKLRFHWSLFLRVLLTISSIGSDNDLSSGPLLQIMAWRRPDDKPFYEPIVVSLLTHIWHSVSMSYPTHVCITWPQLTTSINKTPVIKTSWHGNAFCIIDLWWRESTSFFVSISQKPRSHCADHFCQWTTNIKTMHHIIWTCAFASIGIGWG